MEDPKALSNFVSEINGQLNEVSSNRCSVYNLFFSKHGDFVLLISKLPEIISVLSHSFISLAD